MCICLNCARINSCEMYSYIEQKHSEERDSDYNENGKLFFPQSPILFCINFFSKQNLYKIEWDVNECLSYQEKPGNWLSLHSKSLRSSSYLSFDLIF